MPETPGPSVLQQKRAQRLTEQALGAVLKSYPDNQQIWELINSDWAALQDDHGMVPSAGLELLRPPLKEAYLPLIHCCP